MLEYNRLYVNDIVDFLKTVDDETFDLIIADYPFRIKGNYVEFVEKSAEEFYRTLKSTGSLYVLNNPINLYKTAHAFKKFIFRNAIILPRKYSFKPPKLYHFRHNQIWFFVKTKEYYFSSQNLSDVWDDIDYRVKGKYIGSIPEEIAERIILTSSKEGDLVLDAFSGFGTISRVAKRLNRNFIAVDIVNRWK